MPAYSGNSDNCTCKYWSRSLYEPSPYSAIHLHSSWFNKANCRIYEVPRRYGYSVRPVRVQETPYEFLVTGIQLNKKEVNLSKNSTIQLEATVLPAYAKNKELAWKSVTKAWRRWKTD